VHPQATSPRDDLLALKRKLDAGGNSAITQYFYNSDAYAAFIDDCARIGIIAPIVLGDSPDTAALLDSYNYVDYVVAGEFKSPNFLVDRDNLASPLTAQDDDESFLFQSSAWAAVAGKGSQISQPKKLMKRATLRPTRNAILPLNERKKKNNRFEWAVISLNATFDPL
jgi:hypothetical protein